MKRKSKLLFFHTSPEQHVYLLLGRRKANDQEDFWWLPGGSLEGNEKEFEAALRELHEELTPDAHMKQVVDNYTRKGSQPPFLTYSSGNAVNTIFMVRLGDGAMERLPSIKDEFEELRWFRVNDLPRNMSREFNHLSGMISEEYFYELCRNFDFLSFL